MTCMRFSSITCAVEYCATHAVKVGEAFEIQGRLRYWDGTKLVWWSQIVGGSDVRPLAERALVNYRSVAAGHGGG